MKLAKQILALTMAVCMVTLAFTSCGGEDLTWVATDKDGEKIPVGIYLYHRFEAYNEALELAEDKSTDAWEQQIEGVTGYEWVKNKAMQEVREYVAVEDKFEELGYTVTEEQAAYAEQQATSRYNYFSGLYDANGISPDSISAIYLNNMKRSIIFQATYAPGGTKGLSTDDLKAELEENYLRFKVLMISKSDAEGNLMEGDALKEAENLRDEYLKRAQDGEDFDQLIIESETDYIKDVEGDENYEPTESDFGHSHEDADAHLTVMRKDSTDASADLLDAIIAAGNNSFGVAEDTSYYYLFQKLDVMEDADTTVETLAPQLTSDIKADDFDVEVAQWGEEVQITFNDKVIDHYLKKDFKQANL